MSLDLESMMLELKNKLQNPDTGINKRLADMNVDKALTDMAIYGRQIVCSPINDQAIYFLVAEQTLINYNQWVVIRPETWTSDEMGGMTLGLQVLIDFTTDNDFICNIMAIRYLKCLRQVYEYDRRSGGLPSWMQQIKQLKVFGYQTAEDNRSWRELGVEIETQIAQY